MIVPDLERFVKDISLAIIDHQLGASRVLVVHEQQVGNMLRVCDEVSPAVVSVGWNVRRSAMTSVGNY